MEAPRPTVETSANRIGDDISPEPCRHPWPLATLLALVVAAGGCSETTVGATGMQDVTASPEQAALRPPIDHSVMLESVGLRSGITADLHVRVFVNEDRPCRDPSRTALAVHGINHTASSWEIFVEEFFTGPPRDQLCAVAALDHPGHGRSGLPEGDPDFEFGQLTVEDYAHAVLEVLDRLEKKGLRPSILMGHSQGTQTLQTAQQFLREGGASLAGSFNVTDVVFLGTQGPRGLRTEWTLPDEVVAEQIADLVTTTPEKGTFLAGPPQVFLENWFINRDLVLSSDAPSLQEIGDNGWNEDIPLAAVQQVRGLGGLEPPSVDRKVFSPSTGTRLHVIHFTDDPWSLNAADIYEFLTGDASRAGFVPLEDPDDEAVHDYQITDPGVVRAVIDLPRDGSERGAN
jgi:pimeloyl-ACP methyl ester carboxylesterase